MLNIEKKLIEKINKYMAPIASLLVLGFALWIRLAARNFVGNDYHYFLYDIPGNRNSFLFRELVQALISLLGIDSIVCAMKCLAYLGDFAVTALAFALFVDREDFRSLSPRPFYLLTAMLLAPVSLLYSAGCMRIDSVCMALLLAGVLCSRKGRFLTASLCFILPALLYPAYFPILLAAAIVLCRKMLSAGKRGALIISSVLLAACLCLLVLLERDTANASYYFGKLYVVDPATGIPFADALQWFLEMFKIYGYFAATGCLLLSVKRPRLRIPALALQVLVVMYTGWRLTCFMAVK